MLWVVVVSAVIPRACSLPRVISGQPALSRMRGGSGVQGSRTWPTPRHKQRKEQKETSPGNNLPLWTPCTPLRLTAEQHYSKTFLPYLRCMTHESLRHPDKNLGRATSSFAQISSLPRQVEEWNSEQLTSWLTIMGLSNLCPIFQRHQVCRKSPAKKVVYDRWRPCWFTTCACPWRWNQILSMYSHYESHDQTPQCYFHYKEKRMLFHSRPSSDVKKKKIKKMFLPIETHLKTTSITFFLSHFAAY